MKEVYVSYNGTLYVPYIAVYVFHGYTGTLYVAYMNALPVNLDVNGGFSKFLLLSCFVLCDSPHFVYRNQNSGLKTSICEFSFEAMA